MRQNRGLRGVSLVAGVALALVAGGNASAQDPLAAGTILGRTELAGAPGMEAILVLREVPPGLESGKHTQSGGELVYIMEGEVILEVEGQAAKTVKAGETFHTASGAVHNVKNASATAPAKALAFYVAKKGAALTDLSLQAE
jgi:quercetin dioxygenase-like cupin family protein